MLFGSHIDVNLMKGAICPVGPQLSADRGNADRKIIMIDMDVGNEKERSGIHHGLSEQRQDLVPLLSGPLRR